MTVAMMLCLTVKFMDVHGLSCLFCWSYPCMQQCQEGTDAMLPSLELDSSQGELHREGAEVHGNV